MDPLQGWVYTVTGRVSAASGGIWLPHEHVLVDFGGAATAGPHRYRADAVVAAVLPFLQQAYALGIRWLTECSPEWLGRDVRVLHRLARLTGMRLIAPTGWYGAAEDRFLPASIASETPDSLSRRWITEWRQGIDGTSIRPGFIKIGVDPGMPAPDPMLVQAAARTHLTTGLTIASHTTSGKDALRQLDMLQQAGVSGDAFIWVHAHAEADRSLHREAARRGAWLEYDGLSPDSLEQHIDLIQWAQAHDMGGQILVSHDAGWYQADLPDGGTFRAYDTLSTQLIPALKRVGWNDVQLASLLERQPARAFTCRVRSSNRRG